MRDVEAKRERGAELFLDCFPGKCWPSSSKLDNINKLSYCAAAVEEGGEGGGATKDRCYAHKRCVLS